MQYATPQFIESEGKIISFLTFRQFFWLVGGGGLCLLWYYILPFFLFALAALTTAGLVAVIAFVKVDNTSALTLLFNILGFSVATKNYTWKKKAAAYPFKLQKKTELTTIESPAGPLPVKMQAGRLGDARKLIDTKK